MNAPYQRWVTVSRAARNIDSKSEWIKDLALAGKLLTIRRDKNFLVNEFEVNNLGADLIAVMHRHVKGQQ